MHENWRDAKSQLFIIWLKTNFILISDLRRGIWIKYLFHNFSLKNLKILVNFLKNSNQMCTLWTMNWTKIALFILQHVSVHLHMYKSSLAQFSLSQMGFILPQKFWINDCDYSFIKWNISSQCKIMWFPWNPRKLAMLFYFCSQFHNLHVNVTTAIQKVNTELMLDILSQHQDWCIQKDLCLVHSKFLIAIESLIVVWFLSILFE